MVTFGDGVNGMVPVAGSRILANSYRVGGGALGNVAAGTIATLKTALPQVKSVSNQRAAAGGADAETIDQAKLRAPSGLRSRDRAVTAEDFADLARTTPGVVLKSAYALPQTAVDFTTPEPVFIENAPGSVTVVVLPDKRHPTPQPTEEELRLICAHLNARRLVTTELYVIGPRYTRMDLLQVEIEARQDSDLKAVQDACHAALMVYFNPLTGGEGGTGWPFGGSVYHGNVFNLLLRQPGVLRVVDLKMALETVAQDDTSDVLPLESGSLIELPPSVIALNVRYGRG
jgi:predicted phage baseplate assembly protein